MTAYYNENDPGAAEWLKQLMIEGLIAPGVIDERSIEDIKPNDLDGFRQCHFFAGIGGWALALRLAGWPDDREVWTGSCPCQPFSAAGKGAGTADERHLWPSWFHLIRQCRPRVLFGEQVASPAALEWWDLVHSDLQDQAYATWAADLCAAGVGAPHIRQRLYWVADSSSARLEEQRVKQAWGQLQTAERGSTTCELGDAGGAGSGRDTGAVPGTQGSTAGCVRSLADQPQPSGTAGQLGDASGQRFEQHAQRDGEAQPGAEAPRGADAHRPSFWDGPDMLHCRDGKWRPVEPGTFPLAHGIPGRVGLLRGYGNAIVPQVAAEFIKAYAQVRG